MRAPKHRPGSPKRWPWLVAGLAAGVAGTLAATSWLEAQDASADPVNEQTTVELASATVSTQDLIEEVEWDGVLGYGDPVSILLSAGSGSTTGPASGSTSGGTITASADVGSTVERGQALLHVDQYPVTAFYGDIPAYRTLREGDSGADVRQLEANLVALGYDSDGTVTIDEDFTSYTEAMVERWQEDLEVEVTGWVDASHVAILPGPSKIVSAAEAGTAPSGPVATVTPLSTVTDQTADGVYDGTTTVSLLNISMVVDVADADDFAVGETVTVEQADESLLTGAIAEVGSEVSTGADGSSSVEVLINVDAGGEDLIEGPVVVRTVGTEILNALVVPSRALVSLQEGGFAVEKLVGSSTELVGIDIGAFDDGAVEVVSVTHGSLAAGDEVVVPQ